MKRIQTNKINLNNKSKKSVLSTKAVLLTSMASVLVAVPVSYTAYHFSANVNSGIVFDDKNFGSVTDVERYLDKNAEYKETYMTEDASKSKWTLKVGNTTKEFTDPDALRQHLYNTYMKQQNFVTSLDINKYVDPATGMIIDSSAIAKDLQEAGSPNSATTNIYKGNNDSIINANSPDSQDAAYKSYYAPKQAYYFNNMYFESQETLKTYLSSHYLPSNPSKANSFTVIAPNGTSSIPINPSDKTATTYLKSFIEQNTTKVVQYRKNDKQINITKENYNEALRTIQLGDFNYQHVQSNQGESRYVVDNSAEDNFNLIGPYFYKGNLDVASFTNKNMWKKVDGRTASTKHKAAYQQSQVDNMIGQFFSIILNDDNYLNIEEAKAQNKVPTIFRTLLKATVGQEVKSLDEVYLEQLKEFDKKLYDEVVKTNVNLMKGKKYNTFYKFPVMYSFIMQRLINKNANQTIINQTINYFGQVADFIQDILDIVILDQNLLLNAKGEKFDFRTFFNIGNGEFDLNTTPEYYFEKIKQFPSLVAAMSTYVNAYNNVTMMGGSIAFSGIDQEFLWDYKIIDKEKYYDIYDSLENIYDTFSQLNLDKTLEKAAEYSDLQVFIEIRNFDSEKAMQELSKKYLRTNASVSNIFAGVASANVIVYEMHNAALQVEIADYVYSKKISPEGYLNKIEGKIDWFIEWATANPNAEWYKIYLLMLVDMRVETNIIDSPTIMKDNAKLTVAVNRIIGFSLAAPAAVATAINDLYWEYKITPGLPDKVAKFRSVFVSLGKTISEKYTELKEKLTPRIVDRFKLSHNIPDIEFAAKWSTFNNFVTLDEKVVPTIKKAAPIFGTVFAAVEIFAIVLEFLKVENFTNYYVYTTADGTEFIWDGGQTVSRFFGLDVKETNDINSMKLVEPIQFTLPQISEFYYYDSVRYYNPDELKKDQLDKMLTGHADLSTSQYFSYKYTFDSVHNTNSNVFDSKQQVLDHVVESLGIKFNIDGTIDTNQLKKESAYFNNSSYSFENGIQTNDANKYNVIAENMAKSLRPTLIAKLPELVNGKANSLSEDFKIPGKVWKANGTIEDNTKELSKYVIDNSANTLKGSSVIPTDGSISDQNFVITDRNKAIEDSSNKLYQVFKGKFVLEQKNVLVSSTLSNSKYSSIPSSVNDVVIYKVSLPGSGTKYFNDLGLAQKYILRNVDFEKETQYVEEKMYIYKGQKYYSGSHLENFLTLTNK